MLFGLIRRSGNLKGGTIRLADGAQHALDTARRERWPLLAVAARERSPEYWFASSILDVVSVNGRRPDEMQSTTLTKYLRADLVLTEDMAALKAAHEDELCFVELTVPGRELNRYLEWARTVQ